MTEQKSMRAKRGTRTAGKWSPNKSSGDESEHRHKPPSFMVLLSLICSVALLLRLINVLQTVEMPTVVRLLGDAKGYSDWATRIAGGHWYGSETFYQAPLYPYALAVQIKFLGSGVLGIRIVQALLGTASVFLLGVAGKYVFNNPVGLTAAAMYAVYAPAIYYDGIIQKTSLASFLLCALLMVCAMLPHQDRQWRRGCFSVGIGVLLGLLVLTRENAILWVPVLPFWIWFGLTLPGKQRISPIAGYLAGLAVILLPVAARNASLGGEWSPTTFQAGPNFYIGNNLQSNGLYRPLVPGHETPFYERADAQRLAEQAEGRELTSREVSKFWAARAFEEIRQDPARWIQLMIVKCFMVINRYEVPDVESMYVYRDYSWPLRLLGPWHFGILCPLAVWGIVVTRDQWARLWLYYGLILVMVAAVVLFFILGRYRQPLVPLLILFAAAGLLDVCRAIRTRVWAGRMSVRNEESTKIRVQLVLALIAAVACNITVHDESMLNASSYMNLGIAAGQAGKMGVSIEALARAVQAHPEMAEAHVNLGRALDLSNRPREAITCYHNALTLDPSLVMVDSMLGQSYERIGDAESALRHYQRALRIDPSDQSARDAIRRLMR